MDMLTVLGRQFHASQQLVRVRASRNPNEVIEERIDFGERIADTVARFWRFVGVYHHVSAVLVVYTGINIVLGKRPGTPIRLSC